jgi:hypothetical protein
MTCQRKLRGPSRRTGPPSLPDASDIDRLAVIPALWQPTGRTVPRQPRDRVSAVACDELRQWTIDERIDGLDERARIGLGTGGARCFPDKLTLQEQLSRI